MDAGWELAVGSTAWWTGLGFRSGVHWKRHRVFQRRLARSSASRSAGARLILKAPAFSSACAAFLAPGIGSAPRSISQRSAICEQVAALASARDLSNSRRGAAWFRLSPRKDRIHRRGPAGSRPAEYLPDSAPIARGLYAMSAMPNSRHVSATPFTSGFRRSREYSTWFDASN